MNALERDGFTDIGAVIAITDDEIENLRANVVDVLTPLNFVLKALLRIFSLLQRTSLIVDYIQAV
jgi:hypothetical protein